MMKNIWVRSFQELKSPRNLVICGMMAALAIALNYTASFEMGPYIRIGISGLPNQIVAFLFGPGAGMIFGALLDIIKYLLKPTGPFFPGFTISAALGGMIYGLFLYGRKLPRIDFSDKKVSILSACALVMTVAGEIVVGFYGLKQLVAAEEQSAQGTGAQPFLIIGIVLLLSGSVILFYIFRHLFLAQLLVKIFVNIVLNTLWLKLLYDRAVLAILPGRLLSNTVMLPVDTLLLYIVLLAVRRIVRESRSEQVA